MRKSVRAKQKSQLFVLSVAKPSTKSTKTELIIGENVLVQKKKYTKKTTKKTAITNANEKVV